MFQLSAVKGMEPVWLPLALSLVSRTVMSLSLLPPVAALTLTLTLPLGLCVSLTW